MAAVKGRIKLITMLAMVSTAVILPTTAYALIILTGCANPAFCTLAELLARAGGVVPSIRVDDKIFNMFRNFSSSVAPGSNAAAVIPMAVDVTPIGEGTGDPGLEFTSGNPPNPRMPTQFVVGTNPTPSIQNTSFDYTVQTVPGMARIRDNELDMSLPSLVGSGFVRIDENHAFISSPKEVEADLFSVPTLVDVRSFAPLNVIPQVRTSITVSSDGSPAFSSAELFSFRETFSQVPEPSTESLFIIPLFTLALLRMNRGKFGRVLGTKM
jgi:hypothetical protein